MQYLLQGCLERQVTGAAPDIDGLLVVCDDPVLGDDIPIAQVATSDVSCKSDTLARGNVLNPIETAKDADGLVLAAMTNVELRNLVRCGVASVGDNSTNGV